MFGQEFFLKVDKLDGHTTLSPVLVVFSKYSLPAFVS
jgi:hypothetical protein